VLLVCSDLAGAGPLREVTGCVQSFGCALVIAPERAGTAIATLQLRLQRADSAPARLSEPLAEWRAGNPAAGALDLLAALACRGQIASVPATDHMELCVEMEYPG
jgi:hypothetical protein